VIPIINENDVLSQEELDFSDNDELAALIAAMV
jgi:glutamate 5-kinase